MIDLLYNALIGLAVGDSTGDPFEFDFQPDPEKVLAYAKNESKSITDDTQMTLFGFEAIKMIVDKDMSPEDAFKEAYVQWFRTQNDGTPENTNILLNSPLMYIQRAPGNTCISACYAISSGKEVFNNSYGCGSVMRLLPCLSLFHLGYSRDDVIRVAQTSGAVTHKHTMNRVAISDLMNAYLNILENKPVRYKEHIISASKIEDIGEGWIATECVDMAFYAFRNAKTFDELLTLSICHDGDSDSVAAIAGSLWGLSGNEVLYDKFIERELIDEYFGI